MREQTRKQRHQTLKRYFRVILLLLFFTTVSQAESPEMVELAGHKFTKPRGWNWSRDEDYGFKCQGSAPTPQLSLMMTPPGKLKAATEAYVNAYCSSFVEVWAKHGATIVPEHRTVSSSVPKQGSTKFTFAFKNQEGKILFSGVGYSFDVGSATIMIHGTARGANPPTDIVYSVLKSCNPKP